MANLEIQIGADNSELLKKIDQTEKEIKKLEKQEQILIKAGLDTSGLNQKIKESKSNLDGLRSSLNSTSKSFEGASKSTANAGNTLTNFSRIAQDAPFGIIGIGNNLTATAEAFSSLSKEAGGAGGALKALGSSLMGGGGVLLAISLVTTALTVMSQKGITVGDVFDKLTGNFNQFKKDLSEVNKEAAKNSAEEVQRVRTLTEVAKDEALTRQARLVAVKKLQDEYPAYFGNLTKEQILSGNVATAVRDVVEAIKEKAKAQALSGKLGDLAAKEFELREKEAPLIKSVNESLKEQERIKKRIEAEGSTDRTRQQLAAAIGNTRRYREELDEVQDELRGVIAETNKWANESVKASKKAILIEFVPEKVKKAGKQLQEQVEALNFKPTTISLDTLIKVENPSLFTSNINIGKDMDEFINRLKNQAKPLSDAVVKFSNDVKNTIMNGLTDSLSSVGDAIGNALATGQNVFSAIGNSILSSMGKFLSDMGGLLIQYGALAVAKGALDQAIAVGGPVSVAAGLAAIAVGVGLKAVGGAIGGMSKKGFGGSAGTNVQGGNSVSTPTSSVNTSSSSGGFQNVVFEISGQSLVGVLSNTLNKNVKLGGSIAI